MGGYGRQCGMVLLLLTLGGGLAAQELAGDLNLDGRVDRLDLARLRANWAKTGALPEDISGDGRVGSADLVQLAKNWGPATGATESSIQIEVYASGSGELLKTAQCGVSGYEMKIQDPEPFWGEEPLREFHNYFVLLSRPGFYSEIAQSNNGEQLETALVPVTPARTNGVVFLCQGCFAPMVLADTPIRVLGQAGAPAGEIVTDAKGHYAADLPAGDYVMEFEDYFGNAYHESVHIGGAYQDLRFEEICLAAELQREAGVQRSGPQ